ncbi:hypothetical protein ACFCP7_11610 [Paenibacillus elgii]
MNFRQLALKNIQGNWHRYIAFFLSSAFSVMVFYIFGSFIYHPDVVNGHIKAASLVKQGLAACQVLIVVFSFFFVLYASPASIYASNKQSSSLTLLIGLFISFLFFVASASILCFKLFTELQEDDHQYHALMRIGMSVPEVRRIINIQIGLLFLLPVVVGAAHATFAYKTLANLLSMNVWSYGALVISIFAVLQFGYFLLTRRAYMAQMKSL